MTERFLGCSDSSREVNHGVIIIGYGRTNKLWDKVINGDECKDYWILRNSWGTSWGEGGFFRLCADGAGSGDTPLGTCLINKYAVWPTMDKNDIDQSV